MPSLHDIMERHSALVRDNTRIEAERREAKRLKELSEAMARARPYLDVLCDQITNEEIDAQLNGDATIMKTKWVESPIPYEADQLCMTAMYSRSFGDYHSQQNLIELATMTGSPLADRLNELAAAGFSFQIMHLPHVGEITLKIWPHP
jgi:hypothetical protein